MESQPQLHRHATPPLPPEPTPPPPSPEPAKEDDEAEAVELVLFHVNECYVYLIPPRKTAASYRADEWNVNKWAWEGVLKVVSKGEDCIIRLEDKTTGELYARAFLREGEQHPVEPVIDSSRYFVLRVEEDIGGRRRHAFIGIGFRERTEAYDFQAALYDHTKYLNKKKVAEEMEQQYQSSSSVDYSLKEGETLVLQLRNKGGYKDKSSFFEQGMNSLNDKSNAIEGSISPRPLLPPPPAPSSAISPVQRSPSSSPRAVWKDANFEAKFDQPSGEPSSTLDKDAPVNIDDDFGDFQAAS